MAKTKSQTQFVATSQGELAEFFDRSISTIKVWSASGMPGRPGHYPIPDITRWLFTSGPWKSAQAIKDYAVADSESYPDRDPCIYIDDRKGMRAETARMLPFLMSKLPAGDAEYWAILQQCIARYSTFQTRADVKAIRERQVADAAINIPGLMDSLIEEKNRKEFPERQKQLARDLEWSVGTSKIAVRWRGGHKFAFKVPAHGVIHIDDRKGMMLDQLSAKILELVKAGRDGPKDSAA